MVKAYMGGATGVLVSGIVWSCTAVVSFLHTNSSAMAVLIIGGMFIFPVSVMLDSLSGRSGKHSPDNPLRFLAIENLGILFAGIFISFVLSLHKEALFFPCMLLIIGARYMLFQSLYGTKIYWALGIVLMIPGFALLALPTPAHISAAIGGITELVFFVVLFKKYK